MDNVFLGILIIITAAILSAATPLTAASAFSDPGTGNRAEKAPVIVSGGGNNIYVVWGTDKIQ